jgi:hypothetical protein
MLGAAALSSPSARATVVTGAFTGHAGDKLTATLFVTALTGFEAGDFTLTFDPSLLALKRVDVGSLTPGFSAAYGPGLPHAADALSDELVSLVTGGGPVDGDGTLFSLVFEIKADAAGFASPGMTIGYDETAYGFSTGTTQLLVNGQSPKVVPVADTASLALVGLFAWAGLRRRSGRGPRG